MPGPLSLCKNGQDYAAYDTAEKRSHGGHGFSGKTEKVHRTKGAPVSVSDAPKNLAKRLRGWTNSKLMQDEPDAFHRPGSNKK